VRPYRKTNKLSFAASLLLHGVVFSGLWFYASFSTPDVRVGDQETQYISSYLYRDNPIQSGQDVNQRMVIAKKTSSLEKTAQIASQDSSVRSDLPTISAPAIASSSSTQSSPPPSSARSSNSGEQTEGLLVLLHQAIQNKQQYPASALQMGRQGRVKVGFKLYPDGTISHLRLIKSSGTESLDKAAMEAVRLAIPFKEIDSYLKAPDDFNIDVVFALAEEN